MGCTVTFHDRIGQDRIAQAVEPLEPIDRLPVHLCIDELSEFDRLFEPAAIFDR